jgi:CDP-glycerol glycerophosphotransferase
MPLLSVVVVLHREQGYVEQCVRSVLDQDFEDVELIAVDDASPDHGPGLLDALAAADPRVSVRHLPERVGLGAARNLALEMASGDYVWFVNTTDLVAPRSLAAVAAHIAATTPDVLLVHHGLRDAVGRTRPGPGRKLLQRVGQGALTLDALPGLARLAPTAFDKILRRDFVGDLGARFGTAGHHEISVTWPALLAAERIVAWGEPVYVRQPRENAVRDRYVSGSPSDVFDQYDAVFAWADRRAVPAERRRLVVPAMVEHELSLLERVPEADRPGFFRRIGSSHRRHARGDEPRTPSRQAAARARLVQRGNYAAFRAADRLADTRRAVVRGRNALSRQRGRAVRRARHERLQQFYRSRLREPLDPNLAVFAAYWYRGYSCNPRAIYEKAKELVPDLDAVWVVRPGAVESLPPGVRHVVANTREYYDLIARARYLVNNVNFPNHLVKRPGSVHVMTHHGTPLKQMGMDQRGAPISGPRIDFDAMLRRCRRWDYSVSSNPFSTLVWERVYPVRYESLETGYPRNDVLAKATEEDVRATRTKLAIRPDQTAVLYAPTHREWHAGFDPVLDLAAFAAGLGDDHVVLARSHYFYGAHPLLRRLHADGVIRDVATHQSVEELCLAADVLVTDYSSIMFDYAVLDRPIVVHAPDWELYRTSRGTYFDLLEAPPGAVARTDAELIEAFASGAVWSEEARVARAAFRARFCSLEDGRAAERVVRRVWFGEPVSEPEPAPALAR